MLEQQFNKTNKRVTGYINKYFLNFFHSLKKANIAYENMFEEVPIVIKNSYLINVMLWELEKKSAVADRHELLSLASR